MRADAALASGYVAGARRDAHERLRDGRKGADHGEPKARRALSGEIIKEA